MSMTTLSNIINPQVMADMISAELPNALQVSKLYKVDRTLTGKAGNTITVPQWAYIGSADDLAEGVEGTVTQMTATDKDYTVKKAVKNVELTDEALLSGYGDPKGEAVRQLKLAMLTRLTMTVSHFSRVLPLLLRAHSSYPVTLTLWDMTLCVKPLTCSAMKSRAVTRFCLSMHRALKTSARISVSLTSTAILALL